MAYFSSGYFVYSFLLPKPKIAPIFAVGLASSIALFYIGLWTITRFNNYYWLSWIIEWEKINVLKKGRYEVMEGLQDIDEKEKGTELLPPFVIGEKTKLFIPILRKVCNNLTMFFRYMNEDDDVNINDNVIGLQYNRTNNFTNSNTIQSLISVFLNKDVYDEENSIINDITRVFNIDSDTIKDEIHFCEKKSVSNFKSNV